MNGREMWETYCHEVGISVETDHDEWKFCGGGSLGDELANLVLEGKKTATASLYDLYVLENEDIPKEGCLSVILYDDDSAACIIKDYSVSVRKFMSVPRYHAYLEGENDRSILYWRKVHSEVFDMEAKDCGITFSSDNKIVLEKFNVVYPFSYDDIALVEPSEKYLDQVLEYKNEFISNNETSLDGTGNLVKYDDMKDWLSFANDMADEEKDVTPYVHATQLMAVRKSDDRLVGMIQLRHTLNDYLFNFGGHIGYSVRPSERKKGYAKWMLQNVLPYAKSQGIDKVLITCNEKNAASRNTILACGGEYEDTVLLSEENENIQRYWITL